MLRDVLYKDHLCWKLMGFDFEKPALRLTPSPKILTYGKSYQMVISILKLKTRKTKLMKEMLYELLKDEKRSNLARTMKLRRLFTTPYRVKSTNESSCAKPPRRDNVSAIEEAKDLAILSLDELIGNLKVYETILGSDGVVSKPIEERVMRIDLKANITRGQTSNNSTCQDESDEDEEINLIAKNFRKLSQKGVKKHDKFDICKVKTKCGESSRRERACYNCGIKNHLVDSCPKPNKNKAFVRMAWSDS
ncbi:synaptobrevin, longin-like domain protein [Tanacetum coccineum]